MQRNLYAGIRPWKPLSNTGVPTRYSVRDNQPHAQFPITYKDIQHVPLNLLDILAETLMVVSGFLAVLVQVAMLEPLCQGIPMMSSEF